MPSLPTPRRAIAAANATVSALGLLLLAGACAHSGAAPAASSAAAPSQTAAPAGVGGDYLIGVVSESGDIVTWIRPTPDALVVDHVVPVGVMPADIDGPHNIAMAPDMKSYYVTIAHGTPYGSLWRLDAATDSIVGRAPVELFPTTIGLTPDGDLAFVANSDFYGDRPRINPVTVVHTPTMTKITDVPACNMPHGVKANHAGTKIYVSCMHDDEILEVDVGTFGIARRARVGTGHETAGAGHDMAAMGGMNHGAPMPATPVSAQSASTPPAAPSAPAAAAPAAAAPAAPQSRACAPTFVSVSPDDRRLYVACNTGNTLQVLDAGTLALVKEVEVGHGAYNVEPSPDGKWVIVTNKKDQNVSLVDARTLLEVARIPTAKKIVHGVAYSPDGRYAYISAESIGADPGSVDRLDLAQRKMTATIAVPAQPTGITIRRR